jgi:hypothetical protein
VSRHVHSAARSKTYPYTGAVTGGDAQNPAAHGNICIMESCCCGARRYANVNGRHEALPAQSPRGEGFCVGAVS